VKGEVLWGVTKRKKNHRGEGQHNKWGWRLWGGKDTQVALFGEKMEFLPRKKKGNQPSLPPKRGGRLTSLHDPAVLGGKRDRTVKGEGRSIYKK